MKRNNPRLIPYAGKDSELSNREFARMEREEREAKRSKEGYCRHGHRWTPENTYIRPDGIRECRKCRDIR